VHAEHRASDNGVVVAAIDANVQGVVFEVKADEESVRGRMIDICGFDGNAGFIAGDAYWLVGSGLDQDRVARRGNVDNRDGTTRSASMGCFSLVAQC
jgi:hypothetical protein